jgi:hypothetical protein
MQKVTPGQAVSFVPQHTTSQRSYEPVMPFASPPSSSWQLLCLLMQLLNKLEYKANNISRLKMGKYPLKGHQKIFWIFFWKKFYIKVKNNNLGMLNIF